MFLFITLPEWSRNLKAALGITHFFEPGIMYVELIFLKVLGFVKGNPVQGEGSWFLCVTSEVSALIDLGKKDRNWFSLLTSLASLLWLLSHINVLGATVLPRAWSEASVFVSVLRTPILSWERDFLIIFFV